MYQLLLKPITYTCKHFLRPKFLNLHYKFRNNVLLWIGHFLLFVLILSACLLKDCKCEDPARTAWIQPYRNSISILHWYVTSRCNAFITNYPILYSVWHSQSDAQFFISLPYSHTAFLVCPLEYDWCWSFC